jgi:hypothetical protein
MGSNISRSTQEYMCLMYDIKQMLIPNNFLSHFNYCYFSTASLCFHKHSSGQFIICYLGSQSIPLEIILHILGFLIPPAYTFANFVKLHHICFFCDCISAFLLYNTPKIRRNCSLIAPTMDLSVVKDVVAGALLTGSVGNVLACVGAVASAPLLMGSVVSVDSVDRVSGAALLMGSVTTIRSAALLMGTVDIVLMLCLGRGSIMYPIESPCSSSALLYPYQRNQMQLIAQYLLMEDLMYTTYHNNMKITIHRKCELASAHTAVKVVFCFGTVLVNFNCTLM